ncbi:preprotein translocase subunit SecG [bacterium]|nr:MAG: preprotein translocase subunit SecG [bacterium]
MIAFLNILTVVSAILIIVVVLVQNQGSGLGDAFGGGGNVYRSKRGFEKGLFIFTIILGVIFIASILARFIIA